MNNDGTAISEPTAQTSASALAFKDRNLLKLKKYQNIQIKSCFIEINLLWRC
jgi:hypothetical protein